MSIFEKQKKTKKKNLGIKNYMIEQYALLVGVFQYNFKHFGKFFNIDNMGTITLKKLPSNKELKNNLKAFKGKVEYTELFVQYKPLVVSMVMNSLAKISKDDRHLSKRDFNNIRVNLYGFTYHINDFDTKYLWLLHNCLYRLGTGKVNDVKILQGFSNEINGNIETPGIVFNDIMTLGYQLTTTKKYKGTFMKHLDKFNDKDIAKAISKLGKETRQTLKRTGLIDPMAKAFLGIKLVMPDKGMSPDEKFGYKIFMYGLYMLRSIKIEKLVFKYL